MKIFYSSGSPYTQLSGFAKLLWIAIGVIFFLPGVLFVTAVLRFIFAKSFLLGILFVFFLLPAFIKLVFFLFFTVLAGILLLLPFGRSNKNEQPDVEPSEDVVDVKYKID